MKNSLSAYQIRWNLTLDVSEETVRVLIFHSGKSEAAEVAKAGPKSGDKVVLFLHPVDNVGVG